VGFIKAIAHYFSVPAEKGAAIRAELARNSCRIRRQFVLNYELIRHELSERFANCALHFAQKAQNKGKEKIKIRENDSMKLPFLAEIGKIFVFLQAK